MDGSIAFYLRGAAVVGEGISYGEYDTRGKLVAMTGFFEVPARRLT